MILLGQWLPILYEGVRIDMKRFNAILSVVYDGNHGLDFAYLDYGTGSLAIDSQVGC